MSSPPGRVNTTVQPDMGLATTATPHPLSTAGHRLPHTPLDHRPLDRRRRLPHLQRGIKNAGRPCPDCPYIVNVDALHVELGSTFSDHGSGHHRGKRSIMQHHPRAYDRVANWIEAKRLQRRCHCFSDESYCLDRLCFIPDMLTDSRKTFQAVRPQSYG